MLKDVGMMVPKIRAKWDEGMHNNNCIIITP